MKINDRYFTLAIAWGKTSQNDRLRCIGGARYSNGKKKGGSNSKNGNKYLAWAFVEAANFAIRHNKIVKSYYQRKAAKTNQIIAIKTVAHKLARACFYVLRDQVEFDANKAFC